MMLLLGLFLTGFGLFIFFKPEMFWQLTESWKSNDATEPSDLYLFNTRFGGVMCTLVGTLQLIVFFFVE